MQYQTLLAIHIISVIMLLGVGAGSALYKFIADRSRNLDIILHTNKTVVLVDYLVTTPAVLLQPISGVWLVSTLDIPYSTPWLSYSIALYIFSIALWIYAVYLQIKMKNLAKQTKERKSSLDKLYYKYLNIWISLGFLSFLAMATIYYLMIFKPNL